MDNLIKRTQELFDSISHIEDINSWGCLFAAYWVWLALKKEWFDMNKVHLIQIATHTDDIDNNKKFLSNKVDKPCSSRHFVLEIQRTMYHCGGIYDSVWYELRIPTEDTERFSINALKHWDWHPRFNKRTWKAQIKKILWVKF